MEKISATYYDDRDFDDRKLPDSTDFLRQNSIFSYSSDEGQQICQRFREKIASDHVVYLVGFNIAHNSGVSLIEASRKNGIRTLANYEEERFTGIKHYAGYPEKSISELSRLLASLGKSVGDIFCVLYAWNSVTEEKYGQKMILLNGKIIKNKYYSHISAAATPKIEESDIDPQQKKSFYNHSPGLVRALRRMIHDLNLSEDMACIQLNHHENHAYYAYGVSPFFSPQESEKTTMISCIDGGGDCSSASLYKAVSPEIELIKRTPRENSLGVFYMLCATYLGGWSALSSEGRYMGASAWGNNDRLTNSFYKQLRQFFYFSANGEIFINSTMADNEYAGLQEIVGPFLSVEEIWNPDAVLKIDDIKHSKITRDRVDKAAAVQMVFEDALFHIIGNLIHEVQSDQLVLCGGTALNCVANMRLLEHFNKEYYQTYFGKDTQLRIWVPPVPSDQGVVIGAPYQFAMRNGVLPLGKLPTPFICGLSPSTRRILDALENSDFIYYATLGNIHDNASLWEITDWMAYAVAQNAIVGIYQGEAETGPRALGHRSILSNPCNPEALNMINSRVKLRERIRPLAPMVTPESAEKWFHLSPGASANNYDAYDYMVLTVRARDEAKAVIPAVIHKDGTSRIQIVRRENNPLIYEYLKALKNYIGVEVSINTSLNVGSPIVQTPEQALQVFKRARGLDCIFMISAEGKVHMVWAKKGVQKFESNIPLLCKSYWNDKSDSNNNRFQKCFTLALSQLSSTGSETVSQETVDHHVNIAYCKKKAIRNDPLLKKVGDNGSKKQADLISGREIFQAFKEKRISFAEAQKELEKVVINKGNNSFFESKVTQIESSRKQGLKAHEGSDLRDEPQPNIAKSIAIIGISGRFPDAENVHDFWKNLEKGRDSVREAPQDRGWDIGDYFDPRPQTPGKTYTKFGGFISGVDQFDPLFFGISPREAERIDPSERLFLQESWRAIEDAGYSPASLSGKAWGIFACAKGDYSIRIQNQDPTYLTATDSTSSSRLSYLLNLVGPAVSVDTACSSTLTAICYACDSLCLGNSEVAVAGGGGIYTTPNMLMLSSQSLLFSKDGRCYAFDKRANGTVLGEAIGVVVLKPLQRAVKDNDHIYGVIKGWGTNQDGKTNGMTAPSVASQTQLQTEIYAKFGIDPERISMVEAHGTGTKLGDPIEVQALTESFRNFTDKSGYCALGSLKTNIGHAFFGAGVAGVIKILLSMKHGQIPPSLHFSEINPYISIENSPFFINTSLRSWTSRNGYPRCAAVSSFGATGTNAHVVIEEYAEPQTSEYRPYKIHKTYIIVLSAKNKDRLQKVAENLHAYLTVNRQSSTVNLRDLAYTLQVGRTPMDERLAVLVESFEDLKEKLTKFLKCESNVEDLYRGQVKRVPEAANNDSEELTEEIKGWIRQRSYTKLLGLWVKGMDVDWNMFYKNTQVHRISLPTYPFAEDRCWIKEPGAQNLNHQPSGVRKTQIQSSETQSQSPFVPQPRYENPSDCDNQRYPSNSTITQKSYKPSKITLPALDSDPILINKQNDPAQSKSPSSSTLEPITSSTIDGDCIFTNDRKSEISPMSLQEELRGLVAEILYMDQSDVDINKKFIDIGLDSILGVEWIRAINKKYGTALQATKSYDYPTVREFANYLSQELKKSRSDGSSNLRSSHEPCVEVTSLQSHSLDLHECQNDGTLSSTPPKNSQTSTIGEAPSTKLEMQSEFQVKNQPIAIVGMSGRYPDAPDLDHFWSNLHQAKNSIREIPSSRWDVNQYYDPRPSQDGKVYCKWLGLMEEIDCFDPLFFMISPSEAENTDPQHRLFLQEGYKAFEDAGYAGQSLNEIKCGVYLGIMSNEYELMRHKKGASVTTGSSYAIAAARIAYFLNLTGPAISVDTACSSSLVATHLACQALSKYEIDMALVGGVTLYLIPESYVGMCEAGMLSPEGQCKTFDNSADGFVPGEGVGAIVLKRLRDAESNRDAIYGVIIGSGINQDGKTNGITAPSVVSQMNLGREVYDKYGIDPATISYVEMHGTGTKLGDPIELEALAMVFKEKTERKNYCAIGSVKSNIGHTSAAAGVAGIQKVLLSLKHKTLVPTINFSHHNEHFDFESSPFYVNTELKPWTVQSDLPRRAGVSSFGFSGTNAHMVIEEYVGSEKIEDRGRKIKGEGPYLIVLSAKNEERLRESAKNLRDFIRNQIINRKSAIVNLSDVAYTLQVGREAMDERLAVMVRSTPELEERLLGFLNDQSGIDNLYRGRTNGERDIWDQFVLEEDLHKSFSKWIAKGGYAKILQLWVKGVNIDWNILYSDAKPFRTHLPTYPFVRERYWVSETPRDSLDHKSEFRNHNSPWLHPLVHENTSTLQEQRFSTNFTGNEFFLSDHKIFGQRVLPGATYLELARAAVNKALGDFEDRGRAVQLKNVIWAEPVVVTDRPAEIHIGLMPEDDHTVAYEIYSIPNKAASESQLGPAGGLVGGYRSDSRVVHSQGSVVMPLSTADGGGDINKLSTADLVSLRTRCSHAQVSSHQCYESYRDMGIDYGPGHQGLETVWVGENQVLAKLSSPATVSHTRNQFVLHPSLVDAALQSVIALNIKNHQQLIKEDRNLLMPFALKELEIIRHCTPTMWAAIKYHCDTSGAPATLDLEMFDDAGRICARLKRLSSRPVSRVYKPNSVPSAEKVVVCPAWQEKRATESATTVQYSQRLILLCGVEETVQSRIETGINNARCLSLRSNSRGIANRFETYLVRVFTELKPLLENKPIGNILVQIVLQNHPNNTIYSGLTGFLQSVHLENPMVIGQLIEVEPEDDGESILEKLNENCQDPLENHLQYRGGKRFVKRFHDIREATQTISSRFQINDSPFKQGGVYLITGGSGGLGLIFGKEIIDRIKDVTLILVGQSALSSDQRIQLDEMNARGARIVYKQVDVAAADSVSKLIKSINNEFGNLQGIIHAAGCLRDNFVLKKTKSELQEVLAPKVQGTVVLDEACKACVLDFFILFSSGASLVGNPGQADYAAANAFMDAYAEYRNSLVSGGQRRGQTLAINWPLWEEGGMQVNEETKAMLRARLGMIPMRTSMGIEAFYKGLASDRDQVLAMEGDRDTLFSVLNKKTVSTEFVASALSKNRGESEAYDSYDIVAEKGIAAIVNLLASTIKLPAHRIDATAPLEKYGIDSVMSMRLTNQLEKTFGSLPKTLFFEYQTIKALTNYFLTTYPKKMSQLIGDPITPRSSAPLFRDSTTTITPRLTTRRSDRFRASESIHDTTKRNKGTDALNIAVIGLSGKYPQARNIQEFWDVLREGKDCISEIPEDRWDYKAYFDREKSRIGKTYNKWGGFIEGVDQFDPLFFNISPLEAEMMDPQERLFLECVFETIEDAGYTRNDLGSEVDTLSGGNRVGVFVGVMYEEYQLFSGQKTGDNSITAIPGNSSSIANRVSYFCDFHGPSLTLNTMCSSSLTAIHLACQSLNRGECRVAIAGGVNVSIHPNKYLTLAQGQFLSSKGRCESFGQGGDGYVPGEGVGAIVLKSLAEANAHRDHIYGVIQSTAINHGGKTNGYTVPNPKLQANVIHETLKKIAIDPRSISYLEAHGTGTSLGDPIEIAGLKKAFEESFNESPLDEIPVNRFCAVGSVKSNIGHCESAAGIAGVTKVLLQMKYRQLVPSLHSKTLNPNIDFSSTPFFIQQDLTDWSRPVFKINGQTKEYPRRAGVSSFGAGGSNAHVVIEEYLDKQFEIRNPKSEMDGPYLIILSARSEDRLKEVAKNLHSYLNNQITNHKSEFINLNEVAYTLQVGREPMEERLAMMVQSLHELEEKLNAYLQGREDIEDLYCGQVKQHKDTLAVLSADEDMAKTIEAWIAKGKYTKLMDLWVKGISIDWHKLYGQNKPRRISLPTYPFARIRHWIPKSKTLQYPASKPYSLVHENTSELSEQRFTPTFENGLTLLKPVWDSIPLPERAINQPMLNARMILIGGTREQQNAIQTMFSNARGVNIDATDTIETMASELQEVGLFDHIVWIAPDSGGPLSILDSLIQDQNNGVLLGFRLMKALLNLSYDRRELSWTVITTMTQLVGAKDSIHPAHASIHGLVSSMAKEYPQWKVKLVDLDRTKEWPISDIFLGLRADTRGDAYAYRRGEWFKSKLVPVRQNVSDPLPYRRDGTYVVIGGAGGLGEVWSKFMIERCQAQIIWIGRRQRNGKIEAKLSALSRIGPTPMYIAADASNRQSLQHAYDKIKTVYSQVHGVIHSAIGDFDQSLAEMAEEKFRQILSVKVDLSVNMAQVFQQEPLDFVLFFSSMSAFEKPGGMSGYAAGSTFKDAFALKLNQVWSCNVKVMNWGYWGIGTGATISHASKIRLEKMGVQAMDSDEGMLALTTLLHNSIDQLGAIRLRNPQPTELIASDEWISCYSDFTPALIENVEKRLSNPDLKLKKVGIPSTPQKDELENLLLKLLYTTLHTLALLGEKKRWIADLATEGKIPDFYERWVDESRKILVDKGFIGFNEENESAVSPSIRLDALWAEWDQAKMTWSNDSNLKAQVDLLEACVRSLPNILTGKQQIANVMFPNSSTELVEPIYRGNAVVDYFNSTLTNVVVAYFTERISCDPTVQIRILEIGAGTGGTTTSILAGLQPYLNHLAEYCYTDLSKSFLFHAEENYVPNYPILRTQSFDIEKPIAGQGINADHYDLVIAANVLHATKNIRRSLRNTKAPLRRNGLLLLNEISRKSLFAHLSFGLLEGWWLSEDKELRIPGSPLLDPKSWQQVLGDEGFDAVRFPAAIAHELGQQIVVAESNGIVRQQVSGDTNAEPVDTISQHRSSPPAANPLEGPKIQQELRAKSILYFKKIIAKTLRMKEDEIDSSEPLERYGIDSILIVQLTNSLREIFGEISSTLFFEVQTIKGLVDHFIKNQGDMLIKILGIENRIRNERRSSPEEIGIDQTRVVGLRHYSSTERFIKRNGAPSKEHSKRSTEPIAIIGLSGRFAKADSMEAYWENLKSGRDCITEIPPDRWSLQGFFYENPREAVSQRKSYSKWGSFLDGFAEFDPLFFAISPREAKDMDPQERLFLQCSWAALEDAGYTRKRLKIDHDGRVGVFAGITKTGFELYGLDLAKSGQQSFPHTSFSSVANRVSYFLNLKGPSMPIDTMCSSSLTAIHEACAHLHRRECELALVGGVNLYLHSSSYVALCFENMLSKDGRCKSFGKEANGFVPGEGVGVVVLKPLERAIRDHDHTYAVILGTSVNHDGKTNGYTVPNPNAQSELIRETLERAGVNARTVSYIEAHGTGTNLGDPIEVTGLTNAFQEDTLDTGFCALGSAKSNLGHLEAAAGIAGLSKILLQMKHGQLVPSLHAQELNPNIDFSKTPFVLQQKLTEWKRPVITINGQKKEYPRRAGISSFGAGGANAHIIVEEYMEPYPENRSYKSHETYNIVLSARTEDRLKEVARDLHDYLTVNLEPGTLNLHEVAYTLQMGREAMDERLAVMVTSLEELKEKLNRFSDGRDDIEDLYRGQVKRNKKLLATLMAGDEFQETVDRWFASRKYDKLLDLWAKGLTVNWNKLYGDEIPRHISLPTYPFAKERYWITNLPLSQPTQNNVYREGIPITDEREARVSLGSTTARSHEHIDLKTVSEPIKPVNPEQTLLYESTTRYPETLSSITENLKKAVIKSIPPIERPQHKEDLDLEKMDEMLTKILWVQLQSLGWFTEKRSRISELKSKTGLRGCYDRWLEESINVLVSRNYLRNNGEDLIATNPTILDQDVVWKEWDQLKAPWLADPIFNPQVNVVEATLRVLPEILTGRKLVTDILFPKSRMELVEGIYKWNPLAETFNDMVADTVVEYFRERLQENSSVRLRILEIGAGTGGTSAVIFKKLRALQKHVEEYCYTDISKAFLNHAKKEFGPENPYLKCQIFNVEMPIVGQGIRRDSFDLVIANNVLHATKNIRKTLRNAKAALKRHGVILLTELSKNSWLTHLSFGLLEGWWLYEDSELRIPGCPGLFPPTWRAVLESEGFQSVFFPAEEMHDLGQQIVVAESDGIIRKPNRPPKVTSLDRNTIIPQQLAAIKENRVSAKNESGRKDVDVTEQMLRDYVRGIIIEKLSESLDLDIHTIDSDDSFADYGLDSILGVNLVEIINQNLMINLETTILFEYSSVNELTTHILDQHKDIITTALEKNADPDSCDHPMASGVEEDHPGYSHPNGFQKTRASSECDFEKIDEEIGPPVYHDSIAIIGMSGRYAKSKTVNELWEHLANGDDLVEEVSRWDLTEGYSQTFQTEKPNCNHGSFLDDFDQFDPLFFNISGVEASHMDPQQRLFLEESWKALEDAGYAGAEVEGHQCGVYVGCNRGDYLELIKDRAPAQAFWGNAASIIASRIAYYLDLQGPAVAIDTACSSSLVAIHFACQGLWARETELALAGGVFIQCTPALFLAANRAEMLSPTGRCHTFDKRADGFVPGEGVGVIVLKRLQEALADGDHVYGVIKGSGINQDGTTNGITAPSSTSQERLERRVYDTFNINPEQIQMVEAHGTGTILGDPIEVGALTRAFRHYTDKKEYCAIGSIKTNLGHPATAAGIAGIIKILLSFQHKQIPPSLHYQSGNPHIQFGESPFYVNTDLRDWDIDRNSKRCAAISSFGFSGTNAHLVIEEPPQIERRHSQKPGFMMVLSARTKGQLRQQVEQLTIYCDQNSLVDCGDLSHTLLLGRKHFNHRLALPPPHK